MSGLPAALFLFVVFALPLQAQTSNKAAEREQSTFGGEEVPGIPFIKRPVPVPADVLKILKQDDTVKGCLRDNEPTPDKPFSFWFLASSVHLDGPSENDLVVLPNPGWQPGYGCWYSASGIQWFWIFGKTSERYKLILTTPGNGIEILQTKHAGHKDIRSGTIGSAGRYLTTVLYRFNGNKYQEHERKTTEQQ